ncbi:hypothetical protein DFJ73DRAFT_965817 [Zopfochytrium polystomum]|nr:hypothetical protein DFJ73DRAFT_965817 [Zopfochytrium polystomum]
MSIAPRAPLLPWHLSSIHAYWLHQTQPRRKSLKVVLADSSLFLEELAFLVPAFDKDRFDWIKDNLSFKLANCGFPKDLMDRLCGEPADYLLASKGWWLCESEQPPNMSVAAKVAQSACLATESPTLNISLSDDGLPELPNHLKNVTLYAEKFPIGDVNAQEANLLGAQQKWVARELIPRLGYNKETVEIVVKNLDRFIVRGLVTVRGDRIVNRESFRNFIRKYCPIDPKAPPELAVVSCVDHDYVKRAFQREFTDPLHYLISFRKELEKAASGWKDKYYYPGVSLIQTSGSGKSRAVAQLAIPISKKMPGLFVVYCSFMAKDASGFPGRSKIADRLLAAVDESDFMRYFAACYALIKDESTESFLQKLIDPTSADKFWEKVDTEMNSPLNLDSENSVFADSEKLKVVFVFDEARQLLSDRAGNPVEAKMTPFYLMRAAARNFASSSLAVVVIMDTKSRLSDLSPTARRDPSEKVATGKLKHFPPLYLIGSVDVGLLSRYGLPLETALDPFEYLSHGRPLWKSLLDQRKDIGPVRQLAVSKIAGGGTASMEMPPKITPEGAATVIRARVPFLVYRTELAKELVASHLWWCMGVSPKRDHIVVGMPSEPIISDAAACWMHSNQNRSAVLQVFSSLVSKSAVAVGHSGEVVAQLLLVLGRDSAMRKTQRIKTKSSTDQSPHVTTFYFGALSVTDFLRSTFSTTLAEALAEESMKRSQFTNLPDPIAKGKVSFTHFVQMFEPVTDLTELTLLFTRGAAVCCKTVNPGVDLIIPVLLPNRENHYVTYAENMTFILVQVKNYADRGKDPMFTFTSTKGNSAHRCGLGPFPKHLYISIYMGLGGNSSNFEVLEPTSELGRLQKTFLSEHLQRYLTPIGGAYCSEYEACRQTLHSTLALTEEVEHARRCRQISAAAFGLDESIYPCVQSWTVEKSGKTRTVVVDKSPNGEQLTHDVVSSLKKLLRSPSNPILAEKRPERQQILRRMCYPSSLSALRESEQAAFSSPCGAAASGGTILRDTPINVNTRGAAAVDSLSGAVASKKGRKHKDEPGTEKPQKRLKLQDDGQPRQLQEDAESSYSQMKVSSLQKKRKKKFGGRQVG